MNAMGGPARTDVLAVMAHPDDESIYAGATLSALARAGHRIALVSLTDGAGGRRTTAGGRSLADTRRDELVAAGQRLGLAQVRVLDFPDFGKYRDAHKNRPVSAADTLARWGCKATVDAVAEVLDLARPRVVLTFESSRDPNYSLHGHHLAVGAATLVAAACQAADGHRSVAALESIWAVVSPEDLADLAELEDREDAAGRAVTVSAERSAEKRAAVAAHASQRFSSARLLDQLGGGAAPDEAWLCVWRRGRARDDERGPEGPEGVDAPDGAQAVYALAGVPTTSRRLALASDDVGAAAKAGDHRARTWLGWPEPGMVDLRARVEGRPAPWHVVTGQQVGLFGGPALTLAKAAGAVALARRLRAPASFWMATHDHDLQEVEAVWVPHDGGLARRRLRWRGESGPLGAPVGARRLGEGITSALDQLAVSFEGLPHADEAMAMARAAYRPESTLAGAFAALMGQLLPELEVVDPCEPDWVGRYASLFRGVLDAPGRVLEALERRRRALREAGFAVPVNRGEHVLPLFVTDDGGRRRPLAWARGEFFLADRAVARGELLERLERSPERFSPDVLLRPVCQDLALAASHYIAGPGEVGYLAQASALHEQLGVRAAQAWPRPRITLIDAGAEALFSRWPRLVPADMLDPGSCHRWAREGGDSEETRERRVYGQGHGRHGRDASLLEACTEVRRGLLACTGASPVGQPFSDHVVRDLRALAARLEVAVHDGDALEAKEVLELAAKLRDAADDHGCAVAGRPPSRAPVGRVIRHLSRLEAAMARGLKGEDEGRERRRLAVFMAPRARPQARVMSVLEWVARGGPDVGRQLVQELEMRRPLDVVGQHMAWTCGVVKGAPSV